MAEGEDRLRRWRLVLGGGDSDGTGVDLGGRDQHVDAALAAVYGGGEGGPGSVRAGAAGGRRHGGLAGSAPAVARWLGDIRTYFPTTVVRVMQQDAMERLGLRQLLLEPELLEAVEPDVHLVATLLSLRDVLPERTLATARAVVRTVTDQLEQRLAARTRQAVTGALHRAARTRRPRHGDIDWDRTIKANLKHYQPDLGTIIPEALVGFGRRERAVEKDVILCVDQSASMATSVVHAGVLAAALAQVRALKTHMVCFDTSVVDLTDELHDPVELLFGVQLGGGTDIDQALAYCQGLVRKPQDTVLALITDLFEGGDQASMVKRVQALVASGVRVVVLLALSDDGAPAYDHDLAADLAALGVPAFATTPDAFPDLMAAAIAGRPLPGQPG